MFSPTARMRGSLARSLRGWTAGLAVLAAVPAQALDPTRHPDDYAVRNWLPDQGLPQSSVLTMIQSRAGYLWMGTEEGVARFDGHRFEVFDRYRLPELPNNFITAMLEDRRGTVWIGAFAPGLLSYQEGRFVVFGESDGLPRANVRCLFEDADGVLWIGTEGGGLVRRAGGKFTVFTTKDGLGSDIVRRLAADREGNLWIAGPGPGLTRLRDGRFHVLTPDDGFPASPVTALHADRSGNTWVGTTVGEVLLLGGGRPARRYGAADGLPRRPVMALYGESSGALWMGFDGGGVWRLWQGRLARVNRSGALTRFTARTFVEDDEGNLWIGTQAGGLLRLRDGMVSSLGREAGLSSDMVRAVYEAPDGSLWVGTHGWGVSRVSKGRIETFTAADGLSSDVVWALAGQPDGSVWMGTNGGGICRSRAGRFTCYSSRDGLANDVVRSVFVDSHGTLWIGTEGGGLQRYDGGGFTTYTTRDGLPHNVVRVIHEDRHGDLWIGTLGGLARLSGGVIESFAAQPGAPRSSVFAIHEDAEGSLWLGTYGGGLVRYKRGAFATVTTANGLFDDVMYAVLEDAQGWLWMSSNKGIFGASRVALAAAAETGSRVTTRVLGRADGMTIKECNGGTQPAAWHLRDGRLAFAYMGGVAFVDPWRGAVAVPAPRVLMERALLDGRAYELSAPADAPPGRGGFEAMFTGFGLGAPEQLRFRYKLEGFDADWIDAGERRTAFYTNLPPGSYRFLVTASRGDEAPSSRPATFEFRIRPHFYQTGWFLGLVGLVLVGVVAAGHRGRVMHLRRREEQRIRELEAREVELASRVDHALARVRVLSGLLPICAWCKKIRDDGGYWSQIETYIRDHSHADFTHGICPDCRDHIAAPAQTG